MQVIRGILTGTGILSGLVILSILVSLPFYMRDMRNIRNELKSGSKLMDSPYGTIEYIDVGEGIPVLISHATMGGYDQGLLQANAFMGDKYRLIIPSRFGYLRSSIPGDSSFEAQADAYAYLLEQLGIDKVIVQGMSAGGPPAIQFASRYPEKCKGMILLSTAAYAPPSRYTQRKFPLPDFVYDALLNSDYIFWTFLKLAPEALESSFGASDELKKGCPKEELNTLRSMLNMFQPVSLRFKGSRKLDGPAINLLKELPLKNIKAPSLIICAEDDTVAPQEWSEYTAENIDQCELVKFKSGGHVLMGHHEEAKGRTDLFIAKSWNE